MRLRGILSSSTMLSTTLLNGVCSRVVQSTAMWSTVLAGIAAALSFPAMRAQAADMPIYVKAPDAPPPPAVDGSNAKVDGFGGSINNRSVWGSTGAYSVPLGQTFGAQLDGMAVNYQDRFAGGVGGHLFWRNPSVALLGVYASYTHWDQFGGIATGHVGGEGEYYAGPFTLRAVAGVEWGDSSSTTVGFANGATFTQGFNVGTRFFDKVDLSYYFADNLKLSVGHRYLGGRNMVAFGGEYGFSLWRGAMGALFAEGRVGENNAQGVWGGVRIYFGQHDKPLVSRHRQDDPVNGLPDDLISITANPQNSSTPPTNTCPPPREIIDGICLLPPI